MEESSSLGGMFKLSGSNYSIWKPSMLDLLYCKDLYLPLHGDDAKPKDMSGSSCTEKLLVTSGASSNTVSSIISPMRKRLMFFGRKWKLCSRGKMP